MTIARHEGEAAPSKQPRVQADPHAELPIKNYKYVKNCTELYLAQRGIDDIANFDGFVNLESLWLNDNRIERLDGLDQCFRIKELFAQHNRIKSLRGSSAVHFKFLQTLRLNHNRIKDFQATLAVLARLHHLEDLDLYGNPVEEEDNYRLRVIRTVPSLLVLDRHVVSEEERTKASRLRDELVVKSSVPPETAPRSSNKTKSRHGQGDVVAGAPPQAMSGTVKMLFKEVDKIERETEAARRVAVEKETQLLAQQQLQLTMVTKGGGSSPCATNRLSGNALGGLDAWEGAALEKKFRTLEDKPGNGIALERLGPELLTYLADRGFGTTWMGRMAAMGDMDNVETMELVQVVFPGQARVTWKQLQQSLVARQWSCQPLAPAVLKQRAKLYFDTAASLQKRLLSSKPTKPNDEELLAKEMHHVVQRAYHLAALADQGGAAAGGGGGGGGTRGERDAKPLSPLRTRYFTTAFVRAEAESSSFHELKEQSTQVSAELAATYKFQRKDFQKYMAKKAPPATAIVRKQFSM